MSEKLTVENKLDIIDELKSRASLCGKEWEMLLSFSCDENQEIRLAVSEVLALFPTEESEKIFLMIPIFLSVLLPAIRYISALHRKHCRHSNSRHRITDI